MNGKQCLSGVLTSFLFFISLCFCLDCFFFVSFDSFGFIIFFHKMSLIQKTVVTHFGSSLAAEVRIHGVDVCVVHPSPIRSRFYDNAGDGAEVNFFKSTATGPEVLVNHMFASIGHLVISNQGYFPKVMGILHKLVDPSFLVEITARVAHTAGSFIAAQEKEKVKKK